MKIIETISSWNEITVKQFQGFYQVQCKTYNDEDERSDRLINIVYGLSQEEILSLSVASYKTLLLSISSLQNIDIPIGSKSEISVNGNRYCVELDTTKLPNASHMSVFKYFPKTDKEVIESLHYLVARVVCPLRKNIFGKWVKQKHEQRYFDQYCSDISQASVADVFSLFTYYQTSLLEIAKYNLRYDKTNLIKEAKSIGLTDSQLKNSMEIFDTLIKESKN